eukprot:jgi/Botrbrau1/5163/Bobra.0172s0035.1
MWLDAGTKPASWYKAPKRASEPPTLLPSKCTASPYGHAWDLPWQVSYVVCTQYTFPHINSPEYVPRGPSVACEARPFYPRIPTCHTHLSKDHDLDSEHRCTYCLDQGSILAGHVRAHHSGSESINIQLPMMASA